MTAKIKVKDKLEDDTLDLSFCELQEVPIREIVTIKKASHLDLSNNQLISLPKTMVSLTHIVKLDLSKNLLTEIPENIGEMRQLRHLDLYSNQISRLPLSVGDLKNLKWLDLKDNPLTPAVASVAGTCSNSSDCQKCARKIVAFFSNLKQNIEEEKKRRINAATVATVDGSVKKESKKKKKKNAEKEKHIEKTNSILMSEQSDVTDRSCQLDKKSENDSNNKSSGERFCGVFCTIVYSTIVLLAIVGFIISFIIVVLPKYDQTLLDDVVDYLQVQTNLPVKYYQQRGIEQRDLIIENVWGLFNETKIFVEENYQKIISDS